MSSQDRSERPEPVDGPAAFARLQKMTKALLGVSKDEYEQKRAEYDQQAKEKREQTSTSHQP